MDEDDELSRFGPGQLIMNNAVRHFDEGAGCLGSNFWRQHRFLLIQEQGQRHQNDSERDAHGKQNEDES